MPFPRVRGCRDPLAQAVSRHEHSLALEVRGGEPGEDGGKGRVLWHPPAQKEGERVCSRPGLVSGLNPSGSCTHERASPAGHGLGRGQPPVSSSAPEHSQPNSSQAPEQEQGWGSRAATVAQ